MGCYIYHNKKFKQSKHMKTYIQAEKKLISKGFKFIGGLPLTGVAFFNSETNQKAIVMRMAQSNYEIAIY